LASGEQIVLEKKQSDRIRLKAVSEKIAQNQWTNEKFYTGLDLREDMVGVLWNTKPNGFIPVG